jgi:hypothetical protein
MIGYFGPMNPNNLLAMLKNGGLTIFATSATII